MPSGRLLTFGFVGDAAILGWLVVVVALVRSAQVDMNSQLVDLVGTAVRDSEAAIAVGVGVGATAVVRWAFRAAKASLRGWKALP